MINFDDDKSDPKNQIWLDDLIEDDKFSNQVPLSVTNLLF